MCHWLGAVYHVELDIYNHKSDRGYIPTLEMIVIIIAIEKKPNCSPHVCWLVDIILTNAGNPRNLPFGVGLQHPYGWWFWGIADQVGCSTSDSEDLNRVPTGSPAQSGGSGLAREAWKIWNGTWDEETWFQISNDGLRFLREMALQKSSMGSVNSPISLGRPNNFERHITPRGGLSLLFCVPNWMFLVPININWLRWLVNGSPADSLSLFHSGLQLLPEYGISHTSG